MKPRFARFFRFGGLLPDGATGGEIASGRGGLRAGELLLLAAACLNQSGRAADIYWTNLNGGVWNATNNWSPNQVPGAGDNAFIVSNANSGTCTVTLNAAATVNSLIGEVAKLEPQRHGTTEDLGRLGRVEGAK